MKHLALGSVLFIAMTSSAGCLIDDTKSSRGQANAPAANVPDSGSPVRRESASKTLNDAEQTAPEKSGADALKVE